MDSKINKILIIVTVILVAISVFLTYQRVFVYRDYQIVMEISCDPETESCYVYEDEEIDEVFYYKKINKNASNILECDEGDEECAELYCEEDEEDCEIINCQSDNLLEGEICDEV